MSWTPFNLSAVRGTTAPIAVFEYWHTITLTEPVKTGTTTAPITQISGTPIPIEIPDGTPLKFVDDGQEDDCAYSLVVTSGVTPPNSKIITIDPYIGPAIPCEYVADVAPIDLTGRTYTAAVRAKYEDASVLFPLICVTDAAAGTVTVSAITTNIAPNAKFFQMPKSSDELQSVTSESKNPAHKTLVRSAYYWDMKYSQAGLVVPTHMGYFWLLWEATR